MKPLTKDDLEFLDRIGVDDRRMKIIRNNQEDAEKFKKLYESVQRDRDSLMPDIEIVERLKKLLEVYKKEEWHEESHRKMVIRELQETLGEAK